MAREVISLAEATRPSFTDRQVEFCKDLIGVGLTRLTIIGLVVGKDVGQLNHAEVNAGQRLIEACRKELGYGILDARRAQSPHTMAAVNAAAKNHRLKVRIA